MEQKPIKRNKNIVPLSKDHHFSLLFCWKIRQGLKHGIAIERIQKYVRHFWQTDMQLHFQKEEDFLFAPCLGEKVQKALDEHRQIKAEVADIVVEINTETQSQLSTLANLVEAHVRYEERELFPYLETQLTTEQLEKIGELLEHAPKLQDTFTDEFWIIK